jgi:hypothetical protein
VERSRLRRLFELEVGLAVLVTVVEGLAWLLSSVTELGSGVGDGGRVRLFARESVFMW